VFEKCSLLSFQLTLDVAWSPACVDKRCYDYTSLADIVDFIFIMSYDVRSQVFGPCIAWANSPLNCTAWGTLLLILLHFSKLWVGKFVTLMIDIILYEHYISHLFLLRSENFLYITASMQNAN